MTFLMVYAPMPRMWCESCDKATKVVPDTSGQVTDRILAHYQNTHVHGPADEPWDISTAVGDRPPP